jgi:hypothetical protein
MAGLIPEGTHVSVEGDDGSIVINIDGQPVDPEEEEREQQSDGWFDNLVDDIDAGELSTIVDDLIRGVEDDLESRHEWIENRAQGIKLLGLTIEVGSGTGSGDDMAGISKVRHPLLQEAVLRFQANARSELLPTDGPVKIRDDSTDGTPDRDEVADALEKDFNHYLTTVAREYYPDTDRMLLMLGFGGLSFKKVYFCPLRNRPVSESVDAEDLIVGAKATDLATASRVTHRVWLKPSTVRRLQLLGVYKDIDLEPAKLPDPDAAKQAKEDQQGVRDVTNDPAHRNREIYEVYCELDIPGFEHKKGNKPTGLEIPYRVTIDVTSRTVLSIVRNYDENTDLLPEARETFVQYTFIPGFGFYGIGLLHILGNTTNAITAAWREMLDAGMFANFPGFLFADAGGRQNTNEFRVPPGGGAPVKTNGGDIRAAIMPLPYKEAGPGMMQLVENMAQTGMRVGGTSEMQVGEGRADAPVGTTLAMIEQAMKVLNSVHKRMHAAQAHEFQLLKDCFKEHPESFWERTKKPTIKWNEEVLLKALDDNDLVPQADPNTSSHAQRVMKIMALKQLAMSNQQAYDMIAVDKAAMLAMGWSNPDQFLLPAAQRGQPTPEIIKGMADIKADQQRADADTMRAQAAMLKVQQGSPQGGLAGPQGMAPEEIALRHRELDLKGQDLDQKGKLAALAFQRDKMQDQSRDDDREAGVMTEQMRTDADQMHQEAEMAHDRDMLHFKGVLDLARQVEANKMKAIPNVKGK